MVSLLVCLSACATNPPSGEVVVSTLEAESERPWRVLCEGASLGAFEATPFGGEGEVHVEDGRLILEQGSPLTGVTWRGEALPQSGYELELRAARMLGNDFFCAVTFPVGDQHLSLVLGGWGGAMCGLSCLDGRDASENETTTFRSFEKGREYHVRVTVTTMRVEAFVDGERIVDAAVAGRRLGTRPEVDRSKPFGIASFSTRAAIRDLRVRALAASE